MAVGQVSFHDDRKVKKVLVKQRENPIINRLNKTKVEKHPDLKQEKDDRLRELRKRDTSAQQARVCISSWKKMGLAFKVYTENPYRRKKRPG